LCKSDGIRFALWSALCSRFHSLMAKIYPVPIVSIMVLMGSSVLYLPEQAKANTVTVKMTGTVTSGTDVTGVFSKPNYNLTGTDFIVTYYFDDSRGKSCGNGDVYSCIGYASGYGSPLIDATLTITGPGLPGNSFKYGQSGVTVVTATTWRWLNAAARYTYLSARYTETEPVGSQNHIDTDLEILNANWLAIVPTPAGDCWEQALSYTVKPGDTQTTIQNQFYILVREEPSPGHLITVQQANGVLNIETIQVWPTQTPPTTCWP
jgi:hypothetical protein